MQTAANFRFPPFLTGSPRTNETFTFGAAASNVRLREKVKLTLRADLEAQSRISLRRDQEWSDVRKDRIERNLSKPRIMQVIDLAFLAPDISS